MNDHVFKIVKKLLMILVILLNFDYQSYGIHVKEAVFITEIWLEIVIFDAKTSKRFESLSFDKLVPSSRNFISSHPTVGVLPRYNCSFCIKTNKKSLQGQDFKSLKLSS